tara:strand:- start:41 stop:484 length:444 start_codon:yes stop_codon:yes gene_type:complete
MKNFLSLIFIITFLYSCDKESTNYDCTPFGCSEMPNGSWASLEECENMCDCSCGQVVDVVITNGFAGYATPDGSGGVIITGAHDSYTLSYVENYCSKNISTTCEILTIGASHCMEYGSSYDFVEVFNPVTFFHEEEFMCTEDSSPFQ